MTGAVFDIVSGYRKQGKAMKQESPVSRRVRNSRERHRQAGLKRVEVLVPSEKADLVRAYAAQLREGSQSEVVKQVRKLVMKAYKKFHASCLDNISIDPERAGLADAAIVAAALMHRGNTEAYKLGREIRRLAR